MASVPFILPHYGSLYEKVTPQQFLLSWGQTSCDRGFGSVFEYNYSDKLLPSGIQSPGQYQSDLSYSLEEGSPIISLEEKTNRQGMGGK